MAMFIPEICLALIWFVTSMYEKPDFREAVYTKVRVAEDLMPAKFKCPDSRAMAHEMEDKPALQKLERKPGEIDDEYWPRVIDAHNKNMKTTSDLGLTVFHDHAMRPGFCFLAVLAASLYLLVRFGGGREAGGMVPRVAQAAMVAAPVGWLVNMRGHNDVLRQRFTLGDLKALAPPKHTEATETAVIASALVWVILMWCMHLNDVWAEASERRRARAPAPPAPPASLLLAPYERTIPAITAITAAPRPLRKKRG